MGGEEKDKDRAVRSSDKESDGTHQKIRAFADK
jgi:hypothetical protein